MLLGLVVIDRVHADGPAATAVVVRPSEVALTPNVPVRARPSNFVPRAATNAPVMPSFKSPYPYGYFGAQPQKMWWMHHGHQRSYLQWALR
jgi:hypothetical protein